MESSLTHPDAAVRELRPQFFVEIRAAANQYEKQMSQDASKRSILGRVMKRVGRALAKRTTRGQLEQGVPDGMPADWLADLCSEKTGEPLRETSFRHLSGWKAAGAYRLYLKSASGKQWTVIYKNDVFDAAVTPALSGLPSRPGPPEYAVYSHRSSPLAEYLPQVYGCWQKMPGRHYQYLLEDLRDDYRRVKDADDHRRVAEALPAFRRALCQWYEAVQPAEFLDYDRVFWESLEDYLEKNITRYASTKGTEPLAQLVSAWPSLKSVRLDEEFHRPEHRTAVHGDLNFSNIHLSRHDPARMKVVDWEWAGTGLPHADLAALLKESPPELERDVVESYAEKNGDLTSEQHWRFYRWCKIERGLLDIAFLAVQDLDSDAQPDFNLSRFIDRSAARVVETLSELMETVG